MEKTNKKPELSGTIFELIPPPPPQRKKRFKYNSQYPSNAAPTASTFGASSTSNALKTNCGGNSTNPEKRSHIRKTGSFGITHKPSIKTTNYLKKGDGHSKLPDPKKFSYKTKRKPKVPTKDETPIMGLTSDTNYIISNAIRNILTEPKSHPSHVTQLWKHPEHGKIPKYLKNVKKVVEQEQQYELDEEERKKGKKQSFQMDEIEREELLKQLKEKWKLVNQEYQRTTHHVLLDTLKKIKRKEYYEAELEQIENDIKLLSHKRVDIVNKS